jgi:hypothetical protein
VNIVKPFVIITFILLSFHHSIAQSWAPAEAIWRYNFIGLGGQGYIQITYVKDTVIEGTNCKRLNKRKFQENAFTGTTQSYNIGSIFTYESNGIIFIRYGGTFDTLYNFNAVPDESWNVPGNSPVNTCNTVSKVVVIDTATIQINNISLRRLIVDYRYNNNSSSFLRDTLIERIGSLRQYMLPWDICLGMVDGNEGGELRCYADHVVGEFKHNFFSDCTVLIGIDESKYTSAIRLFPNPVENILFMSFDEAEPSNAIFKVYIYDIFGKLWFITETNDINNVRVNMTEINRGTYFVAVTNEGNIQYRGKILKF